MFHVSKDRVVNIIYFFTPAVCGYFSRRVDIGVIVNGEGDGGLYMERLL